VPHKYVTDQLIKNLEEEIRTCDSSISRIRNISRGGPDAFKELSGQIKDFLETARNKKDQALDLLMLNGTGNIVDAGIQEKAALLCRGQEKAFEIILDMMENPNRAADYYRKQKEEYEKELAKYRTFEQRPEPK